MPLLAFLVHAVSGQDQKRTSEKRGPAWIFVSPNTETNLSLEAAISKLNSPEESTLIQRARNEICKVRGYGLGFERALGSWSDGAEHSVLITTRVSPEQARYVASVLGRAANQKETLVFNGTSNGTSKLYEIVIRRRAGMKGILAILEKDGLLFRTLVIHPRRTDIYVVDQDGKLLKTVRRATWHLHGRLLAREGSSEFIGDDDRNKAQKLFDAEIEKFRAAHGPLRKCGTDTSVKKSASTPP